MTTTTGKDKIVVIYRHPIRTDEPIEAQDDMSGISEVFGPFLNKQIALDWCEMQKIIQGWKGKFTITTLSKPVHIG